MLKVDDEPTPPAPSAKDTLSHHHIESESAWVLRLCAFHWLWRAMGSLIEAEVFPANRGGGCNTCRALVRTSLADRSWEPNAHQQPCVCTAWYRRNSAECGGKAVCAVYLLAHMSRIGRLRLELQQAHCGCRLTEQRARRRASE